MIRTLYYNDVISDITDILAPERLRNRIERLEQFGQRSANNIVKEIDKVLTGKIKDYIFFGSLNVKGAGRSRFKEIFKQVDYKILLDTVYNKPLKATVDLLSSIDGIGESIAKSIYNRLTYLNDNDILKVVINALKIESTFKPKVGSSNTISNTYCHTGSATPFKDP